MQTPEYCRLKNYLQYLTFIVFEDNQTTDACIMSIGVATTVLITTFITVYTMFYNKSATLHAT